MVTHTHTRVLYCILYICTAFYVLVSILTGSMLRNVPIYNIYVCVMQLNGIWEGVIYTTFTVARLLQWTHVPYLHIRIIVRLDWFEFYFIVTYCILYTYYCCIYRLYCCYYDRSRRKLICSCQLINKNNNKILTIIVITCIYSGDTMY